VSTPEKSAASETLTFADAVSDGFWLSKDHGLWTVGHGFGASIVIVSSGHKSKAAARAALLKEALATRREVRRATAAAVARSRILRWGV
jgi:hypothetical protein